MEAEYHKPLKTCGLRFVGFPKAKIEKIKIARNGILIRRKRMPAENGTVISFKNART